MKAGIRMHKLTFYPIGNADCCLITLNNGKKLIFDYAHTIAAEDDTDKRIDLLEALLNDVSDENVEVLGFTHADNDHVGNASQMFWFDYASTYQGEGRIKFRELWVPASFILEKGLKDDAMVIQKEAKYRLKEGYGIKIFSRPEKLKDWLESQEIEYEDRKKFFCGAGNIVNTFSLKSDNVEFFVHSPFSESADGAVIDRNESSLIFNVLFRHGAKDTHFMLIGDTDAEILAKIVSITRNNDNESRLSWDIYDIPHHCSYLALSNEKGDKETTPLDEIKWLLEQGNSRAILVSCSDKIIDEDTVQPPHFQAANYYKKVAEKISGKFKVTMEHPTVNKPQRLIIIIDDFGARVETVYSSGSSKITSSSSPRAGK